MSTIPAAINRYQVVRLLGAGGMGAVYLARDPELDRAVAIKLVKDDLTGEPDLRERFAREARSAAKLRHPNIITVFDIGEYEGRPFIAMEYIPGETLSEVIRREARLDAGWVLRWMESLCEGLAHAHRAGVVHRDIKPANLMVDQEGVLKIVDFGIARAGESQLTRSGVLVGTANYMAPEQLLGTATDHRTDIFAVGAVFYELLSGKKAFPGTIADGLFNRICHQSPESLLSQCPGIDPATVRVVEWALEKNPSHRYQDLASMAADIARVRAGQPVTGPVPPAASDDAGLTMTPAPMPAPRATPPSGPSVAPVAAPSGPSVAPAAPPSGSSFAPAAPPSGPSVAPSAMPNVTPVSPPRGATVQLPSDHRPLADTSASQRRRRAEIFIDAADTALRDRDFAKARAMLDDATRFDPNAQGLSELLATVEREEASAKEAGRRHAEAEAELNDASSCLGRGDFAAARDHLRRATAAEPESFRAQSLVGRVRQAENAARERRAVATSSATPRRAGFPWLTIVVIVSIVVSLAAAIYLATR